MIGLLALGWCVIAYEALHRPHRHLASLLIPAAGATIEPPDPRPILDRRVGDLKLRDVDLETAIEALRRRAKVNVIIRWPEIGDEPHIAVASRERFSVALYDATVETALCGILHSVDARLAYGLTEGGTIIVTSNPESQSSSCQFKALPASETDAMTRVQAYFHGRDCAMAPPARPPRMLVAYDVRDIAPNPPTPPPLPPLLPAPPVTSTFQSGYGQPYRSITASTEQFALIGTLAEFLPVLPQRQWSVFNTGAPAMFAGRIVTALTPQDHRRLDDLLSQIRQQKTAASAAISPAADVGPILTRIIPELDLDNVTREEAFELIQEKLRVSLVVRWDGFHFVGVEKTARVTLHLRKMSLSGAIAKLLNPAGLDPPAISYHIEAKVLFISEAFEAPREDVRVFDVRDLLATRLARRLESEPPPPADSTAYGKAKYLADLEHDEEDQFIGTVFNTVDPTTWRSGSNNRTEILIWDGCLFIRQAPAAQEHVKAFLEETRAAERK